MRACLENEELARIAVVGSSCSGKTTLSSHISNLLSVPHIELDSFHWLEGWRTRPAKEFRSMVKDAVSGERWVVDGNYGVVRDLVWSRATEVIYLNFPFWVVFGRAVERTLRRGLTREVVFSGNS